MAYSFANATMLTRALNVRFTKSGRVGSGRHAADSEERGGVLSEATADAGRDALSIGCDVVPRRRWFAVAV